MFSFLNKPYPLRDLSEKNYLLPLGIGLFVGLFLLTFRPFRLHELTGTVNYIKIFGYGIVPFLVTYFYLNILPSYLPKVVEERKWTVGKEILFMNIMLLTIAIGNILYSSIFSSEYTQTFNAPILGMVLNTFLVGIIPCVFIVLLEHNKLYNANVADSNAIQLKDVSEAKVKNTPLLVKLENEQIEVHPEHFLYAEAVGNYVKIVSMDKEQISSKMARVTMKNFEEQIHDGSIQRIHRSYFANLDKVIDVKGNAQGFKLSLRDCKEVIPVSRKYVPAVKLYFNESKSNILK